MVTFENGPHWIQSLFPFHFFLKRKEKLKHPTLYRDDQCCMCTWILGCKSLCGPLSIPLILYSITGSFRKMADRIYNIRNRLANWSDWSIRNKLMTTNNQYHDHLCRAPSDVTKFNNPIARVRVIDLYILWVKLFIIFSSYLLHM